VTIGDGIAVLHALKRGAVEATHPTSFTAPRVL
jgi:hypothetical protein